jgi:hypothetical protein
MMPPSYKVGVLIGSLQLLKLVGRARGRAQVIDRVEYDITWH